VRRTVPPSAEIEKRIDELLAGGVGAGEPEGPLSELAKLGAKLIIQRAVEEEFDAFIGRARYERKPEAAPGKRNGCSRAKGRSPPPTPVGASLDQSAVAAAQQKPASSRAAPTATTVRRLPRSESSRRQVR
jgi:hypothetical protein